MILETDLVNKKIVDESNSGTKQLEFISTMITEFEASPKRKNMDVATRYYENKNDILDAKRMVIGRDPETNQAILMESKTLSNNKLSHNFYKKLIRQKIGYMLGKPFTLISVENEDPVAEAMFVAVRQYLGKEFYRMLKNVGRDSIMKGLGWIQVYYDEEGQLKFKRVPSEEIIPLWADDDHTVLSAVIKKYAIESYDGGSKTTIKFVEYHTEEKIYYYKYEQGTGKLVVDTDQGENGIGYPFYVKIDEGGQEKVSPMAWSRIPFIPFKYDPDEQSLLERIKTLIDDYDKKTSGNANNIDDFPNSTMVIKNYDGASKEEFVHNKNAYRTIFVQGDGDAKAVETNLYIEEVDKHLERLRKDIYEFGQGVDTQNKDIRDTSGVALRFLYADLDMDCVDWGSETEAGLMQVIWFVLNDIVKNGGEDYFDVDYNILFNNDIIVNQTEVITNCMNSNGIISPKTIAANHPWSKNVEAELAGVQQAEEEMLALESQYAKKSTPTAK